MTVWYEWDVEEVANIDMTADGQDFAADDIMEHWHQLSFKDCLEFIAKNKPPANVRYDIVLVRDDDDRRSWSYIDKETNTLPEMFIDATGDEYKKVPKKFFKEIEVALKKQGVKKNEL